MKKLFFLLCFFLPLTGCVIMEENFPEISETDTQRYAEWTDVTFENLTGNENLIISRNSQDQNSLNILTPDYNQDFLVVVLLGKDCEKSKSMAPYLNEMATRIVPKIHGMNYVPVFLDIYEDSPNKNVSWISGLDNVNFFMNALTICSDNACQNVFLPLGAKPSTGSVYVVDTHNIANTKKVYSWNLTEEPQVQAAKLQSVLVNALGLEPISFGKPSVDDWDDVDAGNSNI